MASEAPRGPAGSLRAQQRASGHLPWTPPPHAAPSAVRALRPQRALHPQNLIHFRPQNPGGGGGKAGCSPRFAEGFLSMVTSRRVDARCAAPRSSPTPQSGPRAPAPGVGRKPRGPLGRGCEEWTRAVPAWAVGAQAPALSPVLGPPTPQSAGTTDVPAPGLRQVRGWPGVSLRELARSGCLRPGVAPGVRSPGPARSARHVCTFTQQPPSPGGLPGLGVRSPLTHKSFPASSVLSSPGRCGHCLSLGDEGII